MINKNFLRVDDFPSGVRPILPDLSILYRILDAFEEREMYFNLGIVPVLFDEFCKKGKLLTLYKYLIPCQHGYNHKYFKYSKVLIEANDIKNSKTVGVFDEFEGCGKPEIIGKIFTGKVKLENYFQKDIDRYIPVCNILNPLTIEVLKEMNFKTVFDVKENEEVSKFAELIISDYYGVIGNMDFNMKYKSVAIHITWEADWIEANGWDKWIENLDKLNKIND